MVYLDWAATALPDAECLTRATGLGIVHFGNPSSAHPAGAQARQALEDARAALAVCLGCSARELVFTSGATESNSLVIHSLLARRHMEGKSPEGYSVVATGIEHASVHDNLERLSRFGYRVTLVPTGADGIVRTEAVAAALRPDTVMVIVMAVNNITGAIQPVSDIAKAVGEYSMARGRRILVHSDAVQALGKGQLDLHALGVDTAALSAHKISGPRGMGLLYVRAGTPLDPLPRGGEQESGLRPGTENTAGALGFACAMTKRAANVSEEHARVLALCQRLLGDLERIPGVEIWPEARLGRASTGRFSPYIVTVSVPPVPSDVLVRILAERGICVSSGSACASNQRAKRERVYRSMGVDPRVASSAIRVSLGWETTEADVGALCEALARKAPGLVRLAR